MELHDILALCGTSLMNIQGKKEASVQSIIMHDDDQGMPIEDQKLKDAKNDALRKEKTICRKALIWC